MLTKIRKIRMYENEAVVIKLSIDHRTMNRESQQKEYALRGVAINFALGS